MCQVQDLHLHRPAAPFSAHVKAQGPSRTISLSGVKRCVLGFDPFVNRRVDIVHSTSRIPFHPLSTYAAAGDAEVAPAAKRTRPNDNNDPVYPHYHHHCVPPPSPTSAVGGSHPPREGAAGAPVFPSLARLPALPEEEGNPSLTNRKHSSKDDWQRKAIWLERRALVEGRVVVASEEATAEAMDVVVRNGGHPPHSTVVAVAGRPSGDAWAPLPPRQRWARRQQRPRGLSIEMVDGGIVPERETR